MTTLRLRTIVAAAVCCVPVTAWAEPGDHLQRARQLASQGNYHHAREEARRALAQDAESQPALQVLVASSCRLRDAEAVRAVYGRLSAEGRRLTAQLCARSGVEIDRDRDDRRPWRIAFWSAAGATVASAVAATALALHVRSLQREKDELLTAYDEPGLCWVSEDDVCAAAERVGASDLVDVCRRGRRESIAANVMLGLAVPLAVASGYLYYRAYVRVERRPLPLSLRPAAGPTGGGLTLSVGF